MPPTALRDRLTRLAEPLLAALGYELVELEVNVSHGQGSVRVYIDRAEGVGIEDCERVSRELSALFDVEDPMPGAYSLEVSSPGFDRVLRTPGHFARFVGERVRVDLKLPRDGRRRYTGALLAAAQDRITVDVDGTPVQIEIAAIERARIAT